MQISQLGFLPEDRRRDEARQRVILDMKDIAVVVMEAGALRDGFGKEGKAAGDKNTGRALRGHCFHQNIRALAETGLLECRFEDITAHIFKLADTFIEGGFEIQFARHGAFCDRGDFLADPGMGGKLIQRFRCYDGRVHIGDQELFTAVFGRRNKAIDFMRRQRVLEREPLRGQGLVFDADLSGLMRIKPLGTGREANDILIEETLDQRKMGGTDITACEDEKEGHRKYNRQIRHKLNPALERGRVNDKFLSMKKTPNKLILILAVVIAVMAALFIGKSAQTREKAETAPVVREETKAIGALGRIEPRSRVIQLSHDAGPEGARIENIFVEEGQKVTKGQEIAVFSDLPRNEAQLASAITRIGVIEANIRAEEANQVFYEKDYARAAKLAKSDAIARSGLEEAEKNRQQTLSRLDSLRAELESAKADILIAERELEQSRIVSPIDGTVLKIMSRTGERVSDQGIVRIADLSQMDVVAEIYERDMPRLRVGQKAEIRVPGLDKVFTGEVRELGFLVEKNDLNDTDPLADRDNRIVEVRITLDADAIKALTHLIYMQVDVRIL